LRIRCACGGSGGKGRHRGGDGLVKELELLAAAEVTLLADRRRTGPYGLQGGEDGAVGRACVVGTGEDLPGKVSVRLHKGDVLRLETPGGGGWG
jgi:N-methylhydantoinase B